MIAHQANRPIYVHRMRQETSKKAKASKSQLCIRVRILCIQNFIVVKPACGKILRRGILLNNIKYLSICIFRHVIIS